MPYSKYITSLEQRHTEMIRYYDSMNSITDVDLSTQKIVIKSLYLLLLAEFQGTLKLILLKWLKNAETINYKKKHTVYLHYIYTVKHINSNENSINLVSKSYNNDYTLWKDMCNHITTTKLENMPTSWDQLNNILYHIFFINISIMEHSQTAITPVELYKNKYNEFIEKRNIFAHTSDSMLDTELNINISVKIDEDISSEYNEWDRYYSVIHSFLNDIASKLFEI